MTGGRLGVALVFELGVVVWVMSCLNKDILIGYARKIVGIHNVCHILGLSCGITTAT
jgi:hypothetical protein